MVRKMHPLRPRQNNPHKAFFTPLHSLHGQILLSNVVPTSLFAKPEHVRLVWTSQ